MSEGARVAIVCGNALPHARLGSHSFWAANRLTLVRCDEDPISILSLCEKIGPSLLVARQTVIEALSDKDVRLITGCQSRTRILVLLNQDNPADTAGLLWRGVHGVLPSRFPAKLLRRAVPAILTGELWAPRRVISGMLVEMIRERTTKPENILTPREERILDLVGQGYKNSEIASSMFISQETVRWHKRRLYRKIGGARGTVAEIQARKIPPSSQSPSLQASAKEAG